MKDDPDMTSDEQTDERVELHTDERAASHRADASRLPHCDAELYAHGTHVYTIANIPAVEIEAWVKRVAEESGQRVDWHYIGGRGVVKASGDITRVYAAIAALHGDLPPNAMACVSDAVLAALEKTTMLNLKRIPAEDASRPSPFSNRCSRCSCLKNEHILTNFADGPRTGQAFLVCPTATYHGD